MKASFSESVVEQAALDWLQDSGWGVRNGAEATQTVLEQAEALSAEWVTA